MEDRQLQYGHTRQFDRNAGKCQNQSAQGLQAPEQEKINYRSRGKPRSTPGRGFFGSKFRVLGSWFKGYKKLIFEILYAIVWIGRFH
jgi:hypothetical protein